MKYTRKRGISKRFGSTQALKDALHELMVAKCELDPDTGCWVWVGAWHIRTGHGVINVNGRQHVAARVAAWVYIGGFGLTDRTIRVMHDKTVCPDTPACCCTEHLIVRARRGSRPVPEQELLF